MKNEDITSLLTQCKMFLLSCQEVLYYEMYFWREDKLNIITIDIWIDEIR